MDEVDRDSAKWQAAYIDAELAKSEYHAAVESARRLHLPEPPPFPAGSETS